MLVIRIWNYFRGYVIIKIEGLTLERFINLAIAKGIYLWDIFNIDYTTLQAKVGIKGFKELRDVVRRVGCRVSIIEKRGFPFVVNKIKYRKMLAFGFVVALGIVFFLTSFIWSIEIRGNETINDEYIIKYLEDMNIKPWISKKNINTMDIKKKMLYDIDKLSYAHVEIHGTKLVVDIKEREEAPIVINKNVPCNIIANKNAVIEKVIAKNGKSVVREGDTVKKGQILITGIIEDERLESPLLVHSEGTVLGRTLYNEIVSEPIVKVIKEETGRSYTAKEIRIFNNRIQLMNGDIPFENYIKEEQSKKVLGNIDMILPIEIVIYNYKEVNVRKVKQNVDALKKMTAVKGVQSVMNKLPKDANVVSKAVKHSIEDNVLITRVSIETIEDIGIKREIKQMVEED